MIFVSEIKWKEVLHGRWLLQFVITVLWEFSNLLSIHKFEAEYLYTMLSMEVHNVESRPLLVKANEWLPKSVVVNRKSV